MANDKGKKRKRSTETTPKDLTIPVLTRSPPSSECRISRYDLDKIGNNLDIDDVFRDLRLKYVGIDACALLLRMLPRKCIPSNWIVTRILGKGAYGIVIGTKKKNEHTTYGPYRWYGIIISSNKKTLGV